MCPRSSAGVTFDSVGRFRLPYYCAPLVCVSDVIKLLVVWWHNKPKTKTFPVGKREGQQRWHSDATSDCTVPGTRLIVASCPPVWPPVHGETNLHWHHHDLLSPPPMSENSYLATKKGGKFVIQFFPPFLDPKLHSSACVLYLAR